MADMFGAVRWALHYMKAQRLLKEWDRLAGSRSHREEFLRKFYDENAHLEPERNPGRPLSASPSGR